MTVLGIDVSKWDGSWDAVKAKKAGAAFVYVKSSQATFTDVQFAANWKKAKEVGLLRGAYHYLDYGKTAVNQANYFADVLKDDPGELPPVVDYEQTRSDNNPAIALSFLRSFLDQMKTRSGLYAKMKYKVPMIYTSPGFWSEYGDTTKREYWLQFPLWVANYTTATKPYLPSPWTLWHIWQFSAKGPGEAYGSESLSMDMNRFNGTENELLEFAGRSTPIVVEPPSTDPTIPAGTDASLLKALEQRTSALETALTKLKLSAEGGMITRLDDLEQSIKSISLVITNSHALLGNRITALEQGIAQSEAGSSGTTDQEADPPVEEIPVETETGAGSDTGTDAIETGTDGISEDEQFLYATCKVNLLNVRKGAGANYAVVAYIKLGQQVKVLLRQNGWAQIEDPAGWVSETYMVYGENIPTAPEASTSTSSEAVTYGVCNTSGLNVRSGPTNTYSVIGGLTYGQRVRILERRDGWAQIEAPSGWCNENYLSFN